MDETSTVKTVLITGCSSGIGFCLAHGLRAAGYRVFATARKEKDITKLKELGFDAFLLDLAPESVLRCVLHALESKIPKNHYRVTFPTKLFGILCRILPSSWMDNILSRADDGDKN